MVRRGIALGAVKKTSSVRAMMASLITTVRGQGGTRVPHPVSWATRRALSARSGTQGKSIQPIYLYYYHIPFQMEIYYTYYEERRSGKTVSVVAGKRQVRLSERVGTHNLL